ncbi:MAG TPA: ABC transporter ATP-binding protein [Bacillota bacterium]
MDQPLLELRGITKRFPGVLANDHIDLVVGKGEIRALLGENGSGKTTLMNVLYGLYQADAGEIFFEGRPLTVNSPGQAIEAGIGMVHQHFMLVQAFTVTENVILGMKAKREPLLGLAEAEAEVKALSEKYGLKVDPKAKIWQLSVGEQQRVEILKALHRKARLLILDEPTAVLTPQEAEELSTILRSLAAEGRSIIFISHKLNEVMGVSDRVTVLRAGRVIDTVETARTSEAELAKMMVGREVIFRIDKKPADPKEIVLEVDALKAANQKKLPALRGVSLKVRAGEILGIAGVDGNGQHELAECIIGVRRADGGRVSVCGQDIVGLNPRQVAQRGVGVIPADRHHQGLVLNLQLAENIMFGNFYCRPYSHRGFLNLGKMVEIADGLIEDYDIRTPSSAVEVRNLSGGNQQKVVLARELSRSPKLIIAALPTRGLDVGATEFVHRKILDARDRGAAILLISTELEEILTLSDRIAVLYEGEVMGVVPREAADVNELGLMMAGAKRLPEAS